MNDMCISCANLCVNQCENPVYIFVNNFKNKIVQCKTLRFEHLFHHFSHLLLHTHFSTVLINTFTHFHKPYYHYNYIYNNINNRKD